MRTSHKAILAAVMAITAMAFAASSASAQVSLTTEPGGVACSTPSVANHEAGGGCEIHASSTELVDLEVFGATISSCQNEFEAQLGATGSGWLTHQTLTGAACAVVPCAESGGGVTPWTAALSEPAGGSLGITVTFCVQGSSTTNCTVTVPVAVAGHSATFSGENPELNCAGTGGLIQVHGNWTTEGSNAEITH